MVNCGKKKSIRRKKELGRLFGRVDRDILRQFDKEAEHRTGGKSVVFSQQPREATDRLDWMKIFNSF